MKPNRAYVLGVALLSACATSSPQKNATSAAAVEEPSAARCSRSEGSDHLRVLSHRDGYALALPGKDWQIECDEEKLFFAESSTGMYVSVKDYDPQGQVEPLAYLADIAANVTGNMREHGFPVTPPRAVTIQVEHQTIPAVFLAVDFDQVEPNTAQLNYWTAQQRNDGIMLDFHVSAIVPTDLTREETNEILDVMERTAGLFSLLEDRRPDSGS